MIAATQQQQQAATTAAPSAEEEALKRNTDCVYFLASPLTCKKGSECEYRHSEYARVNPRDCYFWLNGNCLNPKCGFRHPPLDGLFGTQVSASAGPSLPSPLTAVAPSMHTHQNSGKQAVPCIFFQKGLCLKGDRCAFLHGANPTGNKVSQTMVPAGNDLPPLKKASGGPQKLTQEQKIPQSIFLKGVEAAVEAKSIPKVEIGPPKKGVGVERNFLPSKSMDDDLRKYKATNLPLVVNENSSCLNRLHQSQLPEDHSIQNGKDADEFLRESSPGFDVLVVDELRNADFYHGEDQYGRTRGHEGRNLNTVDEYDMSHSVDYSSVADMDQETYHDLRVYDTYEHMQGQYDWEQHRASSDRMLVGPAHLEQRAYSKAGSPELVDESDLRYRLSKQRRVNGLRSVVSHDFVSDKSVEERGYHGSSRRDSHNLTSHENSISSRLRGRIKLPGRSPNVNDLHVEREMDRRSRGRLSPGRSQMSSHYGRFRDRIKLRGEEDYNNEGRNLRGLRMRGEITDVRSTDFAGPKSLAELKGAKCTEGRMQQSLGKRKQFEDYQPSEGDLSFQGPMPLSEILKRKREVEAAASGSGISSLHKYDPNQKGSKKNLLVNSNNAAVAETKGVFSSMNDEASKQVLKSEEESKSATVVENAEDDAVGQYSSQLPNPSEHETEDGMIVDDGIEDHEFEGDDQREGDYEYEQLDEGEYFEEGENAEVEEEYVDDEDGDDFAKKIGVMFS